MADDDSRGDNQWYAACGVVFFLAAVAMVWWCLFYDPMPSYYNDDVARVVNVRIVGDSR